MAPSRERHRFIFIGGAHRSGTTLLADCLGDHPAISGLRNTNVPMDEGQFLQSVYPPYGTRRKLWPIRFIHPVAPDFLTLRGYGGPGRFGYDPGSHLTEESKLATDANAEGIFQAWAKYWDTSRPMLLEKSPPNLVRTRFLQRLFPDSFYIILRRHPVPVSYATRRWAKRRPFHMLIDHWLTVYERAEADQPKLQRVITLRYEDFVRSPQRVLDQAFRFLELDPIPLAREVSEQVNRDYFARWNRSLQGSSLRTRYAGYMRERYEARVNHFGYTLGNPLLDGSDAGLRA
jgi:hypothetical protein